MQNVQRAIANSSWIAQTRWICEINLSFRLQ